MLLMLLLLILFLLLKSSILCDESFYICLPTVISNLKLKCCFCVKIVTQMSLNIVHSQHGIICVEHACYMLFVIIITITPLLYDAVKR